jgi:hypothetical protein
MIGGIMNHAIDVIERDTMDAVKTTGMTDDVMRSPGGLPGARMTGQQRVAQEVAIGVGIEDGVEARLIEGGTIGPVIDVDLAALLMSSFVL